MAVEPLIEALIEEKLDVRRLAADALSSIGVQALEPLIELLNSEDSELIARIKNTL
jgi:HEAT repeat protein